MKSQLCVLIVFLIGLNTWATDYYVSSYNPARSDGNPGTDPNAPWATMMQVRAVWPTLAPGDAVHMERGSEWDESFVSSWYIVNGGSSGLPITLRGDDYGSGASPIMKHTGGGVLCGYVCIQASYVTVRDFTIDGGNNDYGQNTSGIAIYPSLAPISNVQILNLQIKNLGGSATEYVFGIWIGGDLTTYAVDSCLIQGNYVSDYSAHGLNHYSPNPLTNIVWRNNVVINSYAGGRYASANSAMQVSTSGGGGNVFEFNYLQDTTTTEGDVFLFGKYRSDTSANQIRFNVINNSSAYGVLFTLDGSNFTVLDNMYGNIIYGCAGAGISIQPAN